MEAEKWHEELGESWEEKNRGKFEFMRACLQRRQNKRSPLTTQVPSRIFFIYALFTTSRALFLSPRLLLVNYSKTLFRIEEWRDANIHISVSTLRKISLNRTQFPLRSERGKTLTNFIPPRFDLLFHATTYPFSYRKLEAFPQLQQQ